MKSKKIFWRNVVFEQPQSNLSEHNKTSMIFWEMVSWTFAEASNPYFFDWIVFFLSVQEEERMEVEGSRVVLLGEPSHPKVSRLSGPAHRHLSRHDNWPIKTRWDHSSYLPSDHYTVSPAVRSRIHATGFSERKRAGEREERVARAERGYWEGWKIREREGWWRCWWWNRLFRLRGFEFYGSHRIPYINQCGKLPP